MATAPPRTADLAMRRSWSFVTNHAQVLLAVAQNPGALVSEIAHAAQITQRSTYRILADLQHAGYIKRERRGRNNSYQVSVEVPLRDPMVGDELVRDLLALIHWKPDVEAHLHAIRFRPG